MSVGSLMPETKSFYSTIVWLVNLEFGDISLSRFKDRMPKAIMEMEKLPNKYLLLESGINDGFCTAMMY